MPRNITDPYEVLGVHRGATDADVRAAYLRLAKKHHPDKNPGDKTSEWIFKEVKRAYETLRDVNDVRSAGRERPPRAEEGHVRTRREQRTPLPGDRAERDQRERAERGHQRHQRSERTERQEYRRREQQQAPAAGDRWQRPRAKHTAREDSGPEPTCQCGSVVRWWTRLPRIVRLIGAWAKWALLVVTGTFIYGLFLTLGASALAWVLSSLGLPLRSSTAQAVAVYLAMGLAFGVALWVTKRPSVCPECGRVSSGWS